MFSLNEYISYYLYPRYIDMNKGIECLSELIRSQSKRLRDSILLSVFSSHIFARYKNEALWI